MKLLSVNVGKPYDIIINSGCIDDVGKHVSDIEGVKKCAIITDSNVGSIYGERVKKSLENNGIYTVIHTFEAGEKSKNVESIYGMLECLAENSFTRSDMIVALGGGVTGDMAGFTASIYLRGIKFVQIPTSLLAQIDSSVGGKTGIDLPQGKNLCGAFHQPSLVLIDPDVLSTLPEYYFSDGLAEAIKYGMIKSASLFERLENENAKDFIEDLIFECVDIKRKVVENDEFDNGERMILNFGHTFGHAIEKYYGFEAYSHGQGVAVGMMIAVSSGEELSLTAQGSSARLKKVLEKYNLPYSTDADCESLISTISVDKKCRGNDINFIFISEIGSSFIKKIPVNDFSNIFRNSVGKKYE